MGGEFIKIPTDGGTYKEINDNLKTCLSHNDKIKVIIRGLDMARFIDDKDSMRRDMGSYPTYLYDDNYFNDVYYLFNRDVVFNWVYPMLKAKTQEGFQPGIMSFDDYSYWQDYYEYGVHAVYPDGIKETKKTELQTELTQEYKDRILGNVEQNITSLAEEYPNVTFYYFFTPYSGARWQYWINVGSFDMQIQAERMVIENILKIDNIRLYSFNMRTDLINDLNNYKDDIHYATWINSLMLKYMKEEKYLLTKNNYEQYLKDEEKYYSTLDYFTSYNNQEDYEQDYFAAALLNQELSEVSPHRWFDDEIKENGETGFDITINDIGRHKYLVFYGRIFNENGHLCVNAYNNEGKIIAQVTEDNGSHDKEWHQYLMDLSGIKENVIISFNGDYYTEGMDSSTRDCAFSNITLY